MAGGAGSRFWPASTPSRPKQLLPLASEQPLIRDTVGRIEPLIPLDRVRILTGASLAVPILAAVPQLLEGNLLLEPRAAGTAPVLVWAAAEIERHDAAAVMISLHADHIIRPAKAFRELLASTAQFARRHGGLFTIGAKPTRPETGYGYIRAGARIKDVEAVAFEVAEFVEKPDLPTAERYLASGGFLWNTGIFVWRVADLLEQVVLHTPELAGLVALARAGETAEFFRRTPNLTIDEGLLERSDRVAVVPATFEWDDVGSWDAMFRARDTDEHGNVISGDAHAVDTRRSVLYAEDGPIVAFGADGLIIVRTAGVTFVAPRERASELKQMMAQLPRPLRELD